MPCSALSSSRATGATLKQMANHPGSVITGVASYPRIGRVETRRFVLPARESLLTLRSVRSITRIRCAVLHLLTLLEVVQPECGINTDENQDQLRRPTAQSRPECHATSRFAHKGNDLWARQFSKRKEVHTRPRKNRGPRTCAERKEIYPPHFEIGIFPISFRDAARLYCRAWSDKVRW